jgi:catechol 2,3-dioxygenase-like lactoylglutathione lyase family enzyme
MQITKLDHVNVRTTQLDAMIAWYTRVLGMQSGWRPDFSFNGAWMYLGDSPVVHLVDVPETATGAEVSLKLEHFALAATGSASQFEEKLSSIGERFKRGKPPSSNLLQVNVWDPDGNHIHVDFIDDESGNSA